MCLAVWLLGLPCTTVSCLFLGSVRPVDSKSPASPPQTPPTLHPTPPGTPEGYELYTVDHASGSLRLDLRHAWADASAPQPLVPPPGELISCDPTAGWLCSHGECSLRCAICGCTLWMQQSVWGSWGVMRVAIASRMLTSACCCYTCW